MGRKPRGKIAIAQRRQRVADLYLQGQTQLAIAESIGVTQGTVSTDLKAIRETWRLSAIRDFDMQRDIELQKLDRLEREAWAGWERSQQPAQSAKVAGDKGQGRSEKIIKNQYGDVRFLEQISKCIAQRRAMLGLDAPLQAHVASVNVSVPGAPPEQHASRLAAIWERLQQAGNVIDAIPAAREPPCIDVTPLLSPAGKTGSAPPCVASPASAADEPGSLSTQTPTARTGSVLS